VRAIGLVAWIVTAGVLAPACSSSPPIEPLKLDGKMLTIDNRSSQPWSHVEVWLNTYYRVTVDSIPSMGKYQVPLDVFVAGFGQHFEFRRMQIRDLRLTAKLPDGSPLEIKKAFRVGGLDALKTTPSP
jgi:hypothetical protein